jgi:hypothetical protein
MFASAQVLPAGGPRIRKLAYSLSSDRAVPAGNGRPQDPDARPYSSAGAMRGFSAAIRSSSRWRAGGLPAFECFVSPLTNDPATPVTRSASSARTGTALLVPLRGHLDARLRTQATSSTYFRSRHQYARRVVSKNRRLSSENRALIFARHPPISQPLEPAES